MTDFEPIHFFGQAWNTRLEAMTSFTGSSSTWNWNEKIQVRGNKFHTLEGENKINTNDEKLFFYKHNITSTIQKH